MLNPRSAIRALGLAAALALTAGAAHAQVGRVQLVASNVAQPTAMVQVPGTSNTFFITEQVAGRVRVLQNGTLLPGIALDLRSRFPANPDSEQGLLGLAFDPDFATNRYVYVNFIEDRNSRFTSQGVIRDRGRTVISRFTVNADGVTINPASEHILWRFNQPFTNHNGGQLFFGPDGYLYIASGDGGSGNDPSNLASNLASPLGKMLRIDPRGDDFPADSFRNYAIPATNPFVGQAGATPEVYYYGLRNHWRNAFDPATGDLFIADVGQNALEEINYVPAGSPAGLHFGWRCWEGTICNLVGPECTPCDETGLVFPIETYPRSGPYAGVSITGGYVYRGDAIPRWRGRYFYADFVFGRVWSIRVVDGQSVDRIDHSTDLRTGGYTGNWSGIASFAEDAAGELYLLVFNSGAGGGGVLRIAPERTPGDWNLDGQTDTADITAYLSDWFADRANGTRTAEFTGDNVVNTGDITAFLSAWFADRGG